MLGLGVSLTNISITKAQDTDGFFLVFNDNAFLVFNDDVFLVFAS
jgi:hypothetical protein